MMKLVARALAFFLFSFGIFHIQAQDHCGSDAQRLRDIAKDPSILQSESELEHFTQSYIAAHHQERSDQVYIIPVVFHVIHQYGPENISNAQIYDAVAILNRDFRKMNADTSDIVSEFDTLAADTHIEFRLATKDFFGNCTNGIDRIASVETYVGDNGSKLNQWPREHYLNIWTVKEMANGVAGYSQYPTAVVSFPESFADGVIIRHNYVGSIGTSNEYNSRALTHEVGHYLNLQHTWGDNNDPGLFCGDDGVEDTPETRGWSSCDLNGSTCNPPVVENVQNYMEYAYCSRMYTYGQAERMQAALNNGTSGRSLLWQDSNLAMTGTDEVEYPDCSPQADFYPEYVFLCSGDEISFFDNSTLAAPTAWSWTFEGGEPSTSTSSEPQVVFYEPGWKTVTLTCSNDQGSSTRVFEHCILVAPGWGEVSGLLQENFSNAESFYNSWVIQNMEGDNTSWQRVENAGIDDSYSARLNTFEKLPDFIDTGDNDIDVLTTPSLDMQLLDGGTFSFRYAYATTATDPSDFYEKLVVYSSSNCGRTWQDRLTLDGLDLITAGNISSAFTPTNADQWGEASFTIPNSLEDTEIRFKFEFTSSTFSNNLYIDNVNITGTVGVTEWESSDQLSLYPNPAGDLVSVAFYTPASQMCHYTLSDMQGRVVVENTFQSLAGSQTVDVALTDLSTGIYLVKMTTGGVEKRCLLEKR